MIYLNPAISIIILNINGLNINGKAEIIRLDKKYHLYEVHLSVKTQRQVKQGAERDVDGGEREETHLTHKSRILASVFDDVILVP